MVNITTMAKAKPPRSGKAEALKKAIKNAPKKSLAVKPILNGGPAKKRVVPVKPDPNKYKISPIEKPGKPAPTYGVGPKEQADQAAIQKYLTNDTTYQAQVAAINKALADYSANSQQSINQYNTSYGQNLYDLGVERNRSAIDQQGDFAGRGMLRSGGYAVADSERRNMYASRQSTLDMNKGAFIQNTESDLANFRSSQGLASQQAKQDAINRRALGLVGGGK